MKTLRLSFLVVVFVLGVKMPSRAQPEVKLDDLKREAIGKIDEMRVFTQKMVDQIFSFSELGFQEYETSKYVTDTLKKHGFKVELFAAV